MTDTSTRLSCGGRADDRLHHHDGTPRGTARSADGRELEWFDRHAPAHHHAHHGWPLPTRGPAADQPTSNHEMWVIGALVERTSPDGWTSSRQVPTFYLHPNVQGTLTEADAVRVASGMLSELVDDPDAVFHVHAERVTV